MKLSMNFDKFSVFNVTIMDNLKQTASQLSDSEQYYDINTTDTEQEINETRSKKVRIGVQRQE